MTSSQQLQQESRPPPTVTQETMKKIMWLYRTRTCPLNKRGQCNYGDRCFDSHSAQPERRAPKQNEYNDWHPSTMKCTSLSDDTCKYGRACYFAHNELEIKYHPTMYKTTLCPEYEKNKTCKLGMICPFYHFTDEQRTIEKETLCADCKSDNVSRKAPPPQEFRRWLDGELKRTQSNNNIKQKSNASKPKLNGMNKQHIHNPTQSRNVENEVEIQLPNANQHPFVDEHIEEEKWHQQFGNQSRSEQHLPSMPSTASPQSNSHHLVRAVSTPSSIPSVPTSAQLVPLSNVAMADSLPSGSSRILQSHSNASLGNKSNSQSLSKRKKRLKLKKSRSRKSAGSSLGSIHGHSRHSSSANSKRMELQKMAIDIVKTYKVTRCPKSKCTDAYCTNYHNWEDRRRSPFSFSYSEVPCSRIFDAKTKKFTDNCYGCPMNEACEFSHNYLEIWYHPNVFHTKQCPMIKYQKHCPWGFKCSHYHKKSQKQRSAVQMIAMPKQCLAAPPNLQQHIVGQVVGPQRPPLAHRGQQAKENLDIGSPYSVVSSSFDGSNGQQQLGNNRNGVGNGSRNGLVSPHYGQQFNTHQQHESNGTNKSSPHENNSSYSFNPLMQGIAPSINSWRQKIGSQSTGF